MCVFLNYIYYIIMILDISFAIFSRGDFECCYTTWPGKMFSGMVFDRRCSMGELVQDLKRIGVF